MKYVFYIVSAVAGVAFFVLISQLSQQYADVLTEVTQQTGWYGVLSYVGITVAAIVIAPLGTGFLLPVAANSFGPFWAGTYSIIGWVIGSLIAFVLARRYGQGFVKDMTLVRRIHQFEARLPHTHFILLLVVLRMLLPVDLMSYALGFGSSVAFAPFMVTTVLGVTPFAYLFSYASVASVSIQVVVGVLGMVAFLFGVYFMHQQHSRMKLRIK